MGPDGGSPKGFVWHLLDSVIGKSQDMVITKIVTKRQLMRLFAVKLILSYEQKCNVRSKFLKS